MLRSLAVVVGVVVPSLISSRHTGVRLQAGGGGGGGRLPGLLIDRCGQMSDSWGHTEA